MNNNFILKDDGKIWWIQDLPEDPRKQEFYGKITVDTRDTVMRVYFEERESAISNAVKVDNQGDIFEELERKNKVPANGLIEGKVYSLECSVEKKQYSTHKVLPFIGSVTRIETTALVTFPESGNNEELKSDPEVSEWLRTVDPVLYAVASAAINFARSPSGTKGKMFISKTVEQYASQQCSSLKEEILDCRNALEREKQYLVRVGTEDKKTIAALKEENERMKNGWRVDQTSLKAITAISKKQDDRIKALEEALRDVLSWSAHIPTVANPEILKAYEVLNPTPKTEGTSI